MSILKVVIASSDAERVIECRRLLEGGGRIWVTETAGDSADAVVSVARSRPDVVLLDLDLASEDGPAFIIGLLLMKNPGSKVLVLSSNHPRELILDALFGGAMGCLEWADSERLLGKAVRKVHDGEAWVSRKLVTLILDRLATLIGGIGFERLNQIFCFLLNFFYRSFIS